MKTKRIISTLFLFYCLFILWITIFSRQTRLEGRVLKWEVFWAFRAWLSDEPYSRTEFIHSIENILLFIPFGFLFPRQKWITLILSSIVFSGIVEVIQFLCNIGWCVVDDIISNTLGAIFGMSFSYSVQLFIKQGERIIKPLIPS